MKITFDEVLEDYREDVCSRCGENCNPHYRFCYSTEKTDLNNNVLADFEINACKKCCSSIEKNWKQKLE